MTDSAQTPPPDLAAGARSGARLARWAAHPALLALFLAAVTLIVFYPVVGYQFVSFDDPDYVTSNAQVKGGLTLEGVLWAFQTGHASNWHPLTWISHMLDCQLYGLWPGGHHLTNLLLHVLNTVLLFVALRHLSGTRWRSAFLAALFALHPLHVESVAWVAERKDVLSAFFFILTLWAYGRYAEVRGPKSEVRNQAAEGEMLRPDARIVHDVPRVEFQVLRYYLLSLLFFALGLMSKPMLVTLPFILLLLDYWPLQRLQAAKVPSTLDAQGSTLWGLVVEKWPFFLLTAGSCLVTMLVQERAIQPLTNLSLASRIGNALVAYARYLGKTFWPVNLATPYPHPGRWPLYEVLLAAVLLAGLTLGALRLRRKLPFLPTGWFWFVGMLVPVIGLVQVGEQSIADRYTYLPLIGLFIVLTWGAGEASALLRVPNVVVGIAAGLILVACAARTRDQLAAWQSSERLYRHAVAVTKKNWIAYYNLGSWLDAEGQTDAALTNYFKAVELQPRYPDPLNNIGCILAARKQFTEAIPYFEAAIRSKPDFISAHQNLAAALRESGSFSDAIPHLQQVVKEKPDDTGALNSLGNALAGQGRYPEAIPYYEASLRAKPEQAAAHYNLANALAKLQRTDEAVNHYRLAIQQKPDYAEAYHDLGILLARLGQPDEALVQLREAIRCRPDNATFRVTLGKVLAARRQLDEALKVLGEALRIAPTNADVHSALGTALATTGKLDEAMMHYQEALRYRPDNPTTHLNLGKALAARGRFDEAIRHLNEALRLRPDLAEARQMLQALEAAKPK